ncbi:hypothetical protein KSS87_020942 [Heliosperma pusillum]|nr:hypothetical protein KSS87_020942 [Heliosperma pusillum]
MAAVEWWLTCGDDNDSGVARIDETKDEVERKLELWRHSLESRGFTLSKKKTEYLECTFSGSGGREADSISLDGEIVHCSYFFSYLGSIVHSDGELDGDVAHRIKAGWLNSKSATAVLCGSSVPYRQFEWPSECKFTTSRKVILFFNTSLLELSFLESLGLYCQRDINDQSALLTMLDLLHIRVKLIIEEIEREEEALREDLYSVDRKFAEYYNVLEQILGVLMKLVKDLKLEHQHKYDDMHKTWLIKRCEAMGAKLRVLEHMFLVTTYTQDTVPALHKIRKFLAEATEEASMAYNKAAHGNNPNTTVPGLLKYLRTMDLQHPVPGRPISGPQPQLCLAYQYLPHSKFHLHLQQ